MKIISIRQPWLEVILSKRKNIENRTRPTAYRGWIALHAPAKVAEDDTMPENWTREEALRLNRQEILAVAKIVDVITKIDPRSKSVWFDHDRDPNYGLVLSNVQRLKKPLPYNGGVRGVVQLPEAVTAQIRMQFPKLKLD